MSQFDYGEVGTTTKGRGVRREDQMEVEKREQ